MTRGPQILARLVLAEIEAGRLELRGNQFIRNRQQGVPRLSSSLKWPRLLPRPEVRLQAGEQSKALEMATKFAPLPEELLVKSDITTNRARIARSQQRQASAWPGPRFAPLPEEVLVARAAARTDNDV
jgi:hypothetical protein